MPIQTQVTTNPPDVDIDVSDSGPGGGRLRYLDLHVSYDATKLQFLSVGAGGHKCPKRAGTVHWHMLRCPPAGKKVKLRLKRTQPGKAYVVLCAMDPKNGDYKAKRKRFP